MTLRAGSSSYLLKSEVGESDVYTHNGDGRGLLPWFLLVFFDVLPVLQNLGSCLDDWQKLSQVLAECGCVCDLEEVERFRLLRKPGATV